MDNNLVGQTIQGRYYVVRELGRGGVGVTFLAEDQQCFNSQCVVKQLKPRSTNVKTLEIARRLFNREAEIMNCLGHCDRIPRLLAYFEQEGEFFLVQELIKGHDLSQEIIPGEPWSEEKTLALLKGVLEVLLVVQQHNVIHRDLKPSNLMRRQQDNKIILIDFGSVKQVTTQIVDSTGYGKQTVAVGTKSYMPMEQIMGRPGFYSDIYAMGIIAIQALTGVLPKDLATDDDGELIWRNHINPNIHYQPRFLDILDKMVRRLHQDRYSSAAVVLEELEQLDIEKNNNKDTVVIASQASAKNDLRAASTAEDGVVTTKIISPPESLENSNNHSQLPNVPSVSNSRQKSQKKILPLIIGGITLLAMALGVGILIKNQHEPELNLSLYENSDQGFKINYPEAWEQENRDDFFATGVVFFSPLENNQDTFKEQVSVSVEVLPRNMSLAEYTNESIALIKKLSDKDVSATQATTLGKYKAQQVVYRGEENGNPVKRMQTWSIKNNQAYVITYTAQPESYDNYLPTVEEIIASFETINN
ncbi:TPR repeat-containing serine/threonine protein kinase [Chondrocystis sp. NIES-4102]|nr:TPR repeat-containing serine/threonine protein kinase [Chondrocystis sp. NIES-4102]